MIQIIHHKFLILLCEKFNADFEYITRITLLTLKTTHHFKASIDPIDHQFWLPNIDIILILGGPLMTASHEDDLPDMPGSPREDESFSSVHGG